MGERLAPEVLGPIKTEVLTRMSKDYNDATNHFRDSAGNDVMKGGSNAQFDRVHKMYTEVLEEKATAINQVRSQQQQLQVKDHELSQGQNRQAALGKQLMRWSSWSNKQLRMANSSRSCLSRKQLPRRT